jgi:hypothetical protein
MQEELRFHVESQIADNLRAGMSPGDARDRAARQFGSLASTAEQCRDARGWPGIEDFVQDARYGLRTLWRDRGFALVAILTLALGIGANTAIFTVVRGVMLRPLPYRDPARLVGIWENDRIRGTERETFSAPDFIFRNWPCFSRST